MKAITDKQMSDPVFYHVDVNSAFLSWEAAERLKKDPEAADLRQIPSAIGGDPEKRHGIILAKSTPAKRFGVVTAEPIGRALAKCPDLVLVSPHYKIYAEYSASLMNLLREVAPSVEQFSIDEAFCDMTGTRTLYGDPAAFADRLRARIRTELGFTVNIGVSSNRLLAKMASDFEKPDRTHTLFLDEIPEKMWPLPVDNLLFVGGSTARRLHELGIHTIGDLARSDPRILEAHFKSHGKVMYDYANGKDDEHKIRFHDERKGYSHSMTLPEDLTDPKKAHLILLSLCETVSARIRKDGRKMTSFSVMIRTEDFINYSRQTKSSFPTASAQSIYEIILSCFDSLWEEKHRVPLRLIGVSASGGDEHDQYHLFDQRKRNEKLERLDSALDSVREKYGDSTVLRASILAGKEELPKSIRRESSDTDKTKNGET